MVKLRMPNIKDPRTRARLIVWLLTLTMVVVAVSVSAIALTSRVQFCTLCHEMSSDIAAYRASAHGHISCYGCHMPAGATPVVFMIHKVSALKELYLHFTNSFEKPINEASAYALDESQTRDCQQCHSILTRKVTPSGDVMIDHSKHSNKEIRCSWCHNRVAHPGIEPYQNFMTMEACSRCHTQEATATAAEAASTAEAAGAEEAFKPIKAPGECTACHPKSFELKPPNHLEDGWLPKKHHDAYSAVVASATAGEGGGEAGAAPATPSAIATAGVFADFHIPTEPSDNKPCGVCHAKEFCNDCHGVEMPHPASWKQDHKKYKGQSESCQKCHGSQDFCNRCHHNNVPTTKAWIAPTGHPAAVKSTGPEQCFKCHDPRLCASCHVTGKSNPKYL